MILPLSGSFFSSRMRLRRLSWAIGALSFCFIINRLSAERDFQPSENWSVRVWAFDGLRDRNIAGVALTDDGYVWVANRLGLARFEGATFVEYSLPLLGGKDGQRIRVLQRSRAGGLWLVTDAGRGDPDRSDSPVGSQLIHLHGEKSTVLAGELPDATPEALAETPDGAVWIIYARGVVVRVKDGAVKHFSGQAGFGKGRFALAIDREGVLWFAQDGVIGVVTDDRFQPLLKLRNTVTRMTGSKDGGVWISSGNTLLRYRRGETATTLTNDAPASSALWEDRDGGLWIATIKDGLWRFKDGGLEQLPTSDAMVTSLAEDGEGNIWAGTQTGLNQIRPRTLVVEGSSIGLPSEAMRSLAQDRSGRLWGVAADGKLLQRTQGEWGPPNFGRELPPRLACVAAGADGSIWAGSSYGASEARLYSWKGDSVTSWGEADGLISAIVNVIHVSRNGDVIAGAASPAAVVRIRNGKMQQLPLPSGDLISGITAVCESNDGQIWLGTSEGRLLRVMENGVEEAARSPIARRINTLESGSDGEIWIGYSTTGVVRYKRGQFSIFDRAAGLEIGGVTHLLLDGNNGMWMCGDGGIFLVREADLNAVAEKRLAAVQPIQFGDLEGVPGHRLFSTRQGGKLRSSDGRLYFGLGTALVRVNPSAVPDELPVPPVRLTAISVKGSVVASYHGSLPPAAADGTIPLRGNADSLPHLAPDHERIDFDFTCLSLREPRNVRFRYRLLGYDDTWSEAQLSRRATFRQLPAGDYRFEVKASNSEGRWSDEATSVVFRVTPFFWNTWWFLSGAILALTVSVFYLARLITHRRLRRRIQILRQQAAIERERTRIARDIHDDVGNRLTGIMLLSRLALRDGGAGSEAAPHLTKIATAAAEVTDSLDEIVWAVNPRNDTLDHVVGYLANFAVEFLRSANIRCQVFRPPTLEAVTVSSEVRHNLFLAIKEAVHNVVRHADATEVTLRFVVSRGWVTASVEDNGSGLNVPTSDANADGLLNMRRRMEDVGGRFEAGTRAEGGTRVTLVVPVV